MMPEKDQSLSEEHKLVVLNKLLSVQILLIVIYYDIILFSYRGAVMVAIGFIANAFSTYHH